MENKNSGTAIISLGIVMVLIAAGALAQPSVHDVAGTASLNGAPASVGAVISAKDSNGTELGNFTIATQGVYGFLHVSGDDPGTTGQTISFFINGVQAEQTLIWQPFALTTDFNLTACDLSTYSITATLDSSAYNPGNNMTITGYLLNSQCSLEPGKAVAYSIPGTPMMGQIQTNGTGYFTAIVTIPSDIVLGNYTLWASYPPGYPLGANQTMFSTVNFSVFNPPVQPPSGGSTSSSGGGGGGCSPSWNCSSFSDCEPSGIQTRTCFDQNSCGTNSSMPALTQNCTYTSPGTGNQTGCVPGTRSCSGNDLMECSSDGAFVKIQTCQFGCSEGKCNEGPGTPGGEGNQTNPQGAPLGGFFLLESSSWPYWILIALAVILVLWYVSGRGKKKPARSKK
jgi:hypothetical protein